MRKLYAVVPAVLAVFAAIAWGAEAKLDDVKCMYSGKAVKADASVDYRGGKVYFCCPNCVKEFAKDTEKQAAKANHQLVLTGQAKQVGCPFSGKPVDAAATVKVNGVDVAFCCKNCQGKVAKTESDAEKGELVFNNGAFDKGFKVE